MNEKERAILFAAFTLFNKLGPKKTTIDDIAREARVGKGTIYLYFKTKEEIFEAVQRQKSRMFLDDLRTAMQQGEDVRAQLRIFLTRRCVLLENFARRSPIEVDVFHETLTQPEFQKLLSEFEANEDSLLGEILEAGMRSGEFRALNLESALWVIRQALRGLTVNIFFDRKTEQREARMDQLHEMLMNGLRRTDHSPA